MCDLQDGRPRWIEKPNGEIRWETSEASLARAWGDSSMSKLDLIHFGRDKPRTMEEATSALPLALGSSRQYPVWPLTETKAAEAAASGGDHFSAEFQKLQSLAKKLATYNCQSRPGDYESSESSQEDCVEIERLEKALGSTLRRKRAKLRRKRMASKSKKLPGAKKAKLGSLRLIQRFVMKI